MSTTWIIIPTYWTDQSKTGNFDHPTPINGQSTLPRLLDSLLYQDEPDLQVLILAGAVDESVLPAAAVAVQTICRKYANRLRLIICDLPTVLQLRKAFNLPENAFNLTIYAGIRNLQLLVPNGYGAELIIGLDDDEKVSPNYVREASRYMNTSVDGQPVLGMAGPYEDEHGKIDLIENKKTGNIFLDKSRFMNAGLRKLVENPAPVVSSPQVFGGNMLFHKDLFTQVGFDPGITRGEDMDYMINAHLKGYPWFMASDLRITHLPPKHYDIPAYAKLKQDVIRFVYECAKIEANGVNPELFDPYPGRFLRDDIDAHALEALKQNETPELSASIGTPEEILGAAHEHAKQSLPAFEKFQAEWPEWMAAARSQVQPHYVLGD